MTQGAALRRYISGEVMIGIQLDEICKKLNDLRAYSPALSQKMEHEEELPDDAVPFLVEQLENAFFNCEVADDTDRGKAMDELGFWLVKSHQFYLVRLLSWSSEAPWCFAFPSSEGQLTH